MKEILKCRGCFRGDFSSLVNLGDTPISNEFLENESQIQNEVVLPLEVVVCNYCGFTQLKHEVTRSLMFNDKYLYFSSYSESWLEHSKKFASAITAQMKLQNNDLVVEIASNDGYLLKFFKELGVGVLGIEPSANVADVAINQNDVSTVIDFFSLDLARDLVSKNIRPKLICANNVLAHVPDIHDFIAGVGVLLAPDGVATFEFPHLSRMIKSTQFDTIYHEHYSYLSISTIEPILEKHGLFIFEIEELPTHGGSLRVYTKNFAHGAETSQSTHQVRYMENLFDPRNKTVRDVFRTGVEKIRNDLRRELRNIIYDGKRFVAYGAAAKGNTLLNFCGVSAIDLPFVGDANPSKQGKLLPGSHIPVVSLNDLLEKQPEVILVLPWNLKEEIIELFKSQNLKRCDLLFAVPEIEYIAL